MVFKPYDTDSQSRNVLASPLGEEGHEVAKGWTRVRMIMILLFYVLSPFAQGAADWRSGPRWSILSVRSPVHPFPLRGTSPRWEACHWIFRSLRSLTNPVPLPPQGETRNIERPTFCLTDRWRGPRQRRGVYEGKNNYDTPSPVYAGPTLTDSETLCRGKNKTPRNNLLINPPLEMTVVASALRHFDQSEAEWRNLTPQ